MSITNIKQELLEHVEGMYSVKAVQLKIERYTEYLKIVRVIHLPEGYDEEQLQSFLRNIDTTYDNGYGNQMLYGFIWWKDGTWSSRYEYDGAEEWVHHEIPHYPLNQEQMMEL